MLTKLALLAIVVPLLAAAAWWLVEMVAEFLPRSVASARKSR